MVHYIYFYGASHLLAGLLLYLQKKHLIVLFELKPIKWLCIYLLAHYITRTLSILITVVIFPGLMQSISLGITSRYGLILQYHGCQITPAKVRWYCIMTYKLFELLHLFIPYGQGQLVAIHGVIKLNNQYLIQQNYQIRHQSSKTKMTWLSDEWQEGSDRLSQSVVAEQEKTSNAGILSHQYM